MQNFTIEELKEKFIEIYGEKSDSPAEDDRLRVFSAPGRVNLIGEHTDYNGGYVFPAALNLCSTIILRKRNDRTVKLAVTDLPDRVSASLDDLDQYKDLNWGNYQLGVARELQKAGYDLSGCEMLFHDTVPLGAGLSSSAAIEVATAVALLGIIEPKTEKEKNLDMVFIAKATQKAENEYVGVNCGIMDQFISAMGSKDKAVLLNCKDLSYQYVPLNIPGARIVIANTNKKRGLADSKYNERRSECEKGLADLKTVLPDAECLGDISLEEFNKNKGVIKDDTIRKRVEHVITENDRVLKAVEVLCKDDIKEFGKLLIDSHKSLQNNYEVTGKELDTLVYSLLEQPGVLGARMTGAGFGGCTVSIIEDMYINDVIEKVTASYEANIGYKPTFYICKICDGGREIL